MNNSFQLEPIAHIENGFAAKFGVPRQSGISDTVSKIIFEPPYCDKQAFRGLEQYSHLWLIWQFSLSPQDTWSPTVRPPRLGGNIRMGVFATRSPFRPNRLGLSCVKIQRIDLDSPSGPVLYVEGADLVSGTPIFDVKPYVPYADSRPQALSGFSVSGEQSPLEVVFPHELSCAVSADTEKEIVSVLRQDPRPAYQDDSGA